MKIHNPFIVFLIVTLFGLSACNRQSETAPAAPADQTMAPEQAPAGAGADIAPPPSIDGDGTETPAEQAPVEETPAEETPAEETAAEETPVQ